MQHVTRDGLSGVPLENHRDIHRVRAQDFAICGSFFVACPAEVQLQPAGGIENKARRRETASQSKNYQ